MKSKILVLGIFALFLIGTVNAETRSEIRIDSVTWNPIFIEAGDNATIYAKFVLKPITKAWAVENPDNVAKGQDSTIFYKARLEAADDLAKQYVVISQDTKNVGHLFTGESWTTPFNIRVKENAVATSYKMRFSVIETDIDGISEETVKIYEFDLPLKGEVKFNVDSYNVVQMGSLSDINVQITNEGMGSARHVMAKLDMSAPFTTARTSEVYVGDFAGKETKTATFTVSVGSETEANVYKIPLTITYVSDDGVETTVTRDIGVQIDARPEMKLGLEEATELAPGLTGTVSIEVVNEGFVDAKFVKLTLESTEDYDVKSINEFYIGNLDSDDLETDEFTIEINDDVEKDVVPLKVKLEYKGAGSNTEYVKEGTIDVSILSKEEYAAKYQADGTTSMIVGALMIIPVFFIAVLALWFVIKVFLLVKDYINGKLFSK